MSKALIIVDMQNDFVTGSLANPSAQEIVPKIVDLIKSKEYDFVLTTMDTHQTNYLETPEGKKLPVEHCILDTHGWHLVRDISEAIDTYHFSNCYGLLKPTFGTTQIAECLDAFGEFDEVTFCGTCTDICVVSNALILKAMRPNLTINVKADCCAGVTEAKHNAALTVMESCQINII